MPMQRPNAEGSTEKQTPACFNATRDLLRLRGGGGGGMFSPCYTKPNPTSPSETKSLMLCPICVLHYVKSVRLPACKEDGTFGTGVPGAGRKRKGKPKNKSKESRGGHIREGVLLTCTERASAPSQCKMPRLAESVCHIPAPHCSQCVR